jgi:hypothetical protein
MYKIQVPLYVEKNKKGDKWWLNLNNYRNTHYQTLNNVKKKFKEVITSEVNTLNFINEPIKITYVVYPPTKRLFDMDNMAILSKFTGDAIVELGRLEDDNYNWVPEVSFKFGSVDKTNPRCEVIIERINQ